jgi:hypothetical protein
MDQIPRTECVKISELRKIYGSDIDLEKWIQMSNNLYVGRRGRLYITNKITNKKKIFHYPQSKWANPYILNDNCTLQESLDKYREYIIRNKLIDSIHELSGKTLGCFCVQRNEKKPICHAQVLVEFFKLQLTN